MANRYLAELLTPDVLAAEAHHYGKTQRPGPVGDRDRLGEDEIAFLAERDSFYLSTVSSSGWPYLQHRGGPRGFLRAIDDHTLAFADVKGNRQLISTGNLASSDRVAILAMDYPARARLKILGHARLVDPTTDPALFEQVVSTPEQRRLTERVFVIDVVGINWNCPAYITPRYTLAEIEAMRR